jgi:probable phosphoglycerate mutase
LEFYLFRHGETDWNLEKRIQGSTDIELNHRGLEQARDLVPLLRKYNLEAIFSSDLKRAWKTGQIVADELQIPVHKDGRLREANFGEAEGKTVDEIITLYGEELWQNFRHMNKNKKDIRFPGGESRFESVLRMRSVIDELIKDSTFQRVGIATHGGVVRNLLHSYLPDDHESLPIPNCVVYRLSHHEGTFKVEGPL